MGSFILYVDPCFQKRWGDVCARKGMALGSLPGARGTHSAATRLFECTASRAYRHVRLQAATLLLKKEHDLVKVKKKNSTRWKLIPGCL